MSKRKQRNIGVVTPDIKLEAVFYEDQKLIREPVVALVVVEYIDEKGMESIETEPLAFNRKYGTIMEAETIGSYLGMEEGKIQQAWFEDMERIDKSEAKS